MTRTYRILALAVAAVFMVAGAADAQKKKKKKKKKAKEEEPAPVASEEYPLLQKGHAAFIIRDYDKAYGYYKEAGEKAPKNPEVHYYMGCVLKAKGENDDAIESFRTAYLMATGKDEIWKGFFFSHNPRESSLDDLSKTRYIVRAQDRFDLVLPVFLFSGIHFFKDHDRSHGFFSSRMGYIKTFDSVGFLLKVQNHLQFLQWRKI